MRPDAMTSPAERSESEARPEAARFRTLAGSSGGFNAYRVYVGGLALSMGAFIALLPWLAPVLSPPRPGSVPLPVWADALFMAVGGLVMLGTVMLVFFRETTEIDRDAGVVT